jgi:preprotein translocase subunit SecG
LSPVLLAVATAAPKVVPSAALTAFPAGQPRPGGSPLTTAPVLPPGVQPAITPAPVQTAVAQHAPWLTHGIAGIFIISAIALVFLLAIQTTKQEGLTGSIGGRVESAYRGRLGAEEQLKRITGFVAVVFVVTAFILSLTGI